MAGRRRGGILSAPRRAALFPSSVRKSVGATRRGAASAPGIPRHRDVRGIAPTAIIIAPGISLIELRFRKGNGAELKRIITSSTPFFLLYLVLILISRVGIITAPMLRCVRKNDVSRLLGLLMTARSVAAGSNAVATEQTLTSDEAQFRAGYIKQPGDLST